MKSKEILQPNEYQDTQSIIQYDLQKESIRSDITLSDIHELSKQEFNNDTFQKIIIAMLKAGGYLLLNKDLELLVKQRTVSAIVNTDKGNKFLKLVEQNCGVDEYVGGARMREYFPVIQAEKVIKAKNVELIIQPYVDDITTDKGMLTDVVGMLEFLQDEEKNSKFWQTFDEIFSRMYDLTKNTLKFKVGLAKNDRFFYDRLKIKTNDGESGRLEQFYQDANISLGGGGNQMEGAH